MENETIGKRFKKLRKHLEFSQEKFSQVLNITQQSYSMIEKDKRRPNIKILKVIAKKYNVNLNWIVLGYGTMFREFIENIELYREASEEIKKMSAKIFDLVRGVK